MWNSLEDFFFFFFEEEDFFYTYLDIGETKSQEETEFDLEAPKWFLWI